MSFQCPHCFAHSTEIQPASEIAEKAKKLTLKVKPQSEQEKGQKRDLDRQIIKSETARVLIPELDFEIPPTKTRGDINTIEGMLSNIADSLEVGQPLRLVEQPEIHPKIEALIARFRDLAAGKEAFTFILDDLAGNSYIENPFAPHPDPQLRTEVYSRTAEQNEELGYAIEESQKYASENAERIEARRQLLNAKRDEIVIAQEQTYAVDAKQHEKIDTFFNVSDRSACLPGTCHNCSHDCETRMAVVDIPHFKDVIIMTTECDSCGFRDTEVKPAGRVSDHAVKISLKVSEPADMQRDLLKSDTSSISIPEIELDMLPGTLGGKYTTLEGILNDIKSQLSEVNPFQLGDSSLPEEKGPLAQFLDKLDACIELRSPFTFVLDDPLGNSFVFSELGVDKDPKMTIEHYTRTHEQNEELGLNDLQVEPEDYLDAEDLEALNKELAADQAEKIAQGITEDMEHHHREQQEEAEAVRKNMEGVKIGGLIREQDEDLGDQQQ